MKKKLNKLTAGACALLIASAALTAPGNAQFEGRAKEGLDKVNPDCGIDMQASALVNTGQNSSYLYTCSFKQELVCFTSAPCAATVQKCREDWFITEWNVVSFKSPDINTPPSSIVTGYQCWGKL